MKKEAFDTEYERVLHNLEYCRGYFDEAITVLKFFRDNPNNTKYNYWDAAMYLDKVKYAARLNRDLPAIDWIDLTGLEKGNG